MGYYSTSREALLVVSLLSTMVLLVEGVASTMPTISADVTTEVGTVGDDTMTTEGEDGIFENITTLPVDDATMPEVTRSLSEGTDIWKTVMMKFTVNDRSISDNGDTLKNEIETALNVIFKDKFEGNSTSKVLRFNSSGSIVAFVELDFSERMTDEKRRDVLKVLYEIVERNHTLGGLNVEELFVDTTEGTFVRIEDACSITLCSGEMTCYSEGNDCRSVCANNPHYCQNGAICVGASSELTFITCSCGEEFIGDRCEERKDGIDDNNADLYVGIIAASCIAGIIVVAILLATCINFVNKRRIRTGRPGELFGIENVVALELSDENFRINGTFTQTDESFLLARSHKDGVAPKPGHAHKIMQTNDSFLLAKAQLLRAHGSGSRHRASGSPIGVVSGNARRLSGPSTSTPSDVGAPSTSSAGANVVARKPSTKKERAPAPPQSPTATSHPAEEVPMTTTTDEPKSTGERAPQSDEQTTQNDAKNNELPIEPVIRDAQLLEAKEDKICLEPDPDKADALHLYQGRKILKV